MDYLSERTEGEYRAVNPADLPADNYERVYLAHPDASADKLWYDRFEVRTPHNSHMSTVMHIERTMEFRVTHMLYGEQYPLDCTGEVLTIDSCGFTLQNNIRTMTMDYEFSTVVERPSEWVPLYTHMYPNSLAPLVRNSGRNFGVNHDATMFYNLPGRLMRSIELIPDVNLFYDPSIQQYVNARIDGYVGGESGDIFAFHPGSMDDDERPNQPHEPDNYIRTAGLIDITADMNQHGAMMIRMEQIQDLLETYPDVWAIIDKKRGGGTLSIPETDFLTAFSEVCEQILKIFDNNAYWRQPAATFQALRILFIHPSLFSHPDDFDLRRLWTAENEQITVVHHVEDLRDAQNIAYNLHITLDPRDTHHVLGSRSKINFADYYFGGGAHSPVALENAEDFTSDLDKMDNEQLAVAFEEFYRKKFMRGLLHIALKMGLNMPEPTLAQKAIAKVVLGHKNLAGDAYLLPDQLWQVWREVYQFLSPLIDYVAFVNDTAEFTTVYDPVDTHVVLTKYQVDFLETNRVRAKPIRSIFRHTFIEPVVCGLGKPSANCNVGCWKNVGGIIPRINRFALEAHYEDKLGRRLFDTFDLVREQPQPMVTIRRKLGATLHTVHYRHVLKPRVTLVQHCFEKRNLVRNFKYGGSGAGKVDGSLTFEFEFSFRTNSDPVFIWFYTRRADEGITKYQYLPKMNLRGPAITQFVLHNKTRSKVLDYASGDHRARLHQLTQDVFPEYGPPRHHYGGYVCLPYCSIPKSVHVSGFEEQLSGRITVESTGNLRHMGDANDAMRYDLCALIMYKDKFLTVNQNEIRRGFDV